ncbi:hypothetical protein B9Z19DRAFT_1085598 [Tuber borchii]|uniref:Uncharacterized protein n=1 Tax=Tuber borchii TaxID=42251 RepID=A0A2T6ZQK3_TUBBO|nr:hypothetical protein B9Z19DRAFT_1085598 [Tuber borchii]
MSSSEDDRPLAAMHGARTNGMWILSCPLANSVLKGTHWVNFHSVLEATASSFLRHDFYLPQTIKNLTMGTSTEQCGFCV